MNGTNKEQICYCCGKKRKNSEDVEYNFNVCPICLRTFCDSDFCYGRFFGINICKNCCSELIPVEGIHEDKHYIRGRYNIFKYKHLYMRSYCLSIQIYLRTSQRVFP